MDRTSKRSLVGTNLSVSGLGSGTSCGGARSGARLLGDGGLGRRGGLRGLLRPVGRDRARRLQLGDHLGRELAVVVAAQAQGHLERREVQPALLAVLARRGGGGRLGRGVGRGGIGGGRRRGLGLVGRQVVGRGQRAGDEQPGHDPGDLARHRVLDLDPGVADAAEGGLDHVGGLTEPLDQLADGDLLGHVALALAARGQVALARVLALAHEEHALRRLLDKSVFEVEVLEDGRRRRRAGELLELCGLHVGVLGHGELPAPGRDLGLGRHRREGQDLAGVVEPPGVVEAVVVHGLEGRSDGLGQTDEAGLRRVGYIRFRRDHAVSHEAIQPLDHEHAHGPGGHLETRRHHDDLAVGAESVLALVRFVAVHSEDHVVENVAAHAGPLAGSRRGTQTHRDGEGAPNHDLLALLLDLALPDDDVAADRPTGPGLEACHHRVDVDGLATGVDDGHDLGLAGPSEHALAEGHVHDLDLVRVELVGLHDLPEDPNGVDAGGLLRRLALAGIVLGLHDVSLSGATPRVKWSSPGMEYPS